MTMTIREKVKIMEDYCITHHCIECPCYVNVRGKGCTYDGNNINEAYNKIFGKENENMFKAFTDENIRKKFSIKLKGNTDIEKLLNYLKINNIKCNWISGGALDKDTILNYVYDFNHIYLYFYYNGFTGNFVITQSSDFDVLEDVQYNYTIDDIMEESKMFTKKDLKTGMIVETREGSKYLVLLDSTYSVKDVLIKEDRKNYTVLCNYDDDLLNLYVSDMDIVKVYRSDGIGALLNFSNLELIWERKEDYKEMTVADIEKELGYKVKIVKESEEN